MPADSQERQGLILILVSTLAYGTLPIVRATGGLNDTVRDAAGGRPGTGFRFVDYTPEGLLAAVKGALDIYKTREAWLEMQRAAMAGDFSWARSAAAYVEVYEAALARTGRRRVAAR